MSRLAILVALTLAACGGKMPETRYYQLAAPATTAAAPERADVVLAIEPLAVDPAYDDERIVYRVTPYRLDYYNYHRWSATPGTMVADYLERAFERSGRFRSVTRNADQAPVALTGRVVAIEEVDTSKTSWLGRVVVELTLTDTASGDVLWSEQYEETEPLAVQTPEGLAKALSVALHRIAERAIPMVSDLAVKTARAREGADGKSTSAARAARLRP